MALDNAFALTDALDTQFSVININMRQVMALLIHYVCIDYDLIQNIDKVDGAVQYIDKVYGTKFIHCTIYLTPQHVDKV